MPWCLECEAYRAPSSVRTDGTCRTCGLPVDPGRLAEARTAGGGAAPGAGSAASAGDQALPTVPWHLKILGVAAGGYLLLRAWQGIEILLDKL